jgi:hypothetical protein
MIKKLLPVAAIIVATTLHAQAQVPQSGLEITKISATFEKSPEFNLGIGPEPRKANSKDWLWIEAEFTYTPRDRNAPPFLDELRFTYYVLLNNASRENPNGTLLTGSVDHVAISPGKGLHSAMFVSPRTLERFFGGKAPTSENTATVAIGVTISRQGQLVAELSNGKGQGRPQWWSTMQQTPGYLLNKNETPFLPLFWDYFEAIKARQPGQ